MAMSTTTAMPMSAAHDLIAQYVSIDVYKDVIAATQSLTGFSTMPATMEWLCRDFQERHPGYEMKISLRAPNTRPFLPGVERPVFDIVVNAPVVNNIINGNGITRIIPAK